MPLYAGACTTDITPPPGLWMAGYAPRLTTATGVHDPLYASALVVDDGNERAALISADLISLPTDLVNSIRADIAAQIGANTSAIMLHCTHTHGGPYVGTFRCMGDRCPAYEEILCRKIAGAAAQAASELRPARLMYGEAPAQIGVNRRAIGSGRGVQMGHNYRGPVCSVVQTLCVASLEGRTFALLFSHACHPTTVGGDNLMFTGEWPGAATSHLKRRFALDGPANGVELDALPIALQGCCGDVNPMRRGSWEGVSQNGKIVAEAAHTARWNSHGSLSGALRYREIAVKLPTLPPIPLAVARSAVAEWESTLHSDRAKGAEPGRILFDLGHLEWAKDQVERNSTEPHGGQAQFSIQIIDLGGVSILGYPAEMFVSYQLDLMRQSRSPVFALGYTNGCIGYLPAASDYPAGGYEIHEAYKYYAHPMFAPDCEQVVRAASYELRNRRSGYRSLPPRLIVFTARSLTIKFMQAPDGTFWSIVSPY